jgi:hypothetical protein
MTDVMLHIARVGFQILAVMNVSLGVSSDQVHFPTVFVGALLFFLADGERGIFVGSRINPEQKPWKNLERA